MTDDTDTLPTKRPRGRPRKMGEQRMITLKIPIELLARVDDVIPLGGRSAFVREAIEAALATR